MSDPLCVCACRRSDHVGLIGKGPDERGACRNCLGDRSGRRWLRLCQYFRLALGQVDVAEDAATDPEDRRLPHAAGSATSLDAALGAQARAAAWREKIWRFIASQADGATADECAVYFGAHANQIAPRITELKGIRADPGRKIKAYPRRLQQKGRRQTRLASTADVHFAQEPVWL